MTIHLRLVPRATIVARVVPRVAGATVAGSGGVDVALSNSVYTASLAAALNLDGKTISGTFAGSPTASGLWEFDTGFVVDTTGTVASGVSPGLTPTIFKGSGANPAISFQITNNPGVNGYGFYQHWYAYNSIGTNTRAASIGPGLSDTTAGAEQGSVDIGLRVSGAMRSVALAGVGTDHAGWIPDAAVKWVLGQPGQGWTTLRLENSSSGSNEVAAHLRNTAVNVATGGLWKIFLSGGTFAIQMNTSAGGAFATGSNYFAINQTTGDISLVSVNGSTVSPGQYTGTSTNDNASAGNIGQLISSTVAAGSAVSLTNNTAKTVTSISLTAGDWDITAATYFKLGATTSITCAIGDISTTNDTLTQSLGGYYTYQTSADVPTDTNDLGWSHGPLRVSLSGTTTYYLVAFSQFTVSTNSAYGIIRARRVR